MNFPMFIELFGLFLKKTYKAGQPNHAFIFYTHPFLSLPILSLTKLCLKKKGRKKREPWQFLHVIFFIVTEDRLPC